MVANARSEKLITRTTLEEYFRSSVSEALRNQEVRADAETVFYVVNLLTTFARAERLFERTDDGVVMRSLASHYAEAIEGATPEARNRALRRLGDVALFISGVFSHSLNRRVVDVDYYVSMGGGAYGTLSDVLRGTLGGQTMSEIFDELSRKFVSFVDVLGEVSETAHLGTDKDVLRLYETWLRTGSRRAAKQLRAAGIQPSSASSSRLSH